MSGTSVLIALPARDEQDSIAACLRAVIGSAQRAESSGVMSRFRIAVAAHRCADATAAVARLVLTEAGVDHLVLEVDDELPVGAVRSRLIAAALRTGRVEFEGCWILSTDADSLVPADWVSGLLATGLIESADLVAGLTVLSDWAADERARSAYAALLRAGMTEDGHRHVYAANLAVRRSAYEAVGGFPAVRHGEEQALADAIRERGGRVVGALTPVVATSGRMPGRADGGLGSLLQGIASAGLDAIESAERPI